MRGQIMKFMRSPFVQQAVIALGIVFIVLFNHGALSQTRTIKVVVPNPPGGNNDILARLLVEEIGRVQGVAMVIENRAGAGTLIGTEAVARAAPDGATLLINTPAFVAPICNLTREPVIIAVNAGAPYRMLADLIGAARARPAELTLASVPAGTFQIAFETLKRPAKFDMTFVPYPGAAPVVNALLGEHVTSAITTYSGASAQLSAGTLRALATFSQARIASLPDVPTVTESGYKDTEMDVWSGLYAPAKTPKETVTQVGSWFAMALQRPAVRAKLVAQRFFPVPISVFFSGNNMTTTAASFARPASRRSEQRVSVRVSRRQRWSRPTTRTARDSPNVPFGESPRAYGRFGSGIAR
jgi:tripartite-type tricarboxylate transporter receptor subunit TctC